MLGPAVKLFCFRLLSLGSPLFEFTLSGFMLMWIWQDVLCASVMRNNILEDTGIYL